MLKQRFAILGDIHSNWQALETVLADAAEQGVGAYVCVGDVVGYNADPVRCLNRIRELCTVVVKGNHDHYCSVDGGLDDFHPMAATVVEWTRNQLDAEQREYLRELDYVKRTAGFTVVHSTLDVPERWGYVFDTLEADANFNYQLTPLCFHGHTHVPVVFQRSKGVTREVLDQFQVAMGTRYFVNVGSVGQPRDGDPRASYVIYDSDAREVTLRRLEYDIEAAQARILEAGLPERLARRLQFGK